MAAVSQESDAFMTTSSDEVVPVSSSSVRISSEGNSGISSNKPVKVAVVGCAHGHLEEIFHKIRFHNQNSSDSIDLLICCGDFHAVRNAGDLSCLSCPQKFKEMGTFHKYYSGELKAPVLTIFIGGNHEASNHLTELFYGGWAAPSIYYLGQSGVVSFAGLRIGGISGIYKRFDFKKGYGERIPYTEDDIRSVFHTREFDVLKLSQLTKPMDIFLSHDWPTGITKYGDEARLIRVKKHFIQDIQRNELGSPASSELLFKLQPRYWFSAHLHVRFTAEVKHTPLPTPVPAATSSSTSPSSSSSPSPSSSGVRTTSFLALDKCGHKNDYEERRVFFEVLDIVPERGDAPKVLRYDEEWLGILKLTHEHLNFTSTVVKLPVKSHAPTPPRVKRTGFKPTELDLEWIRERLREGNGGLDIPLNFKKEVETYLPAQAFSHPLVGRDNSQTLQLLQLLDLPNTFPFSVEQGRGGGGGGGGRGGGRGGRGDRGRGGRGRGGDRGGYYPPYQQFPQQGRGNYQQPFYPQQGGSLLPYGSLFPPFLPPQQGGLGGGLITPGFIPPPSVVSNPEEIDLDDLGETSTSSAQTGEAPFVPVVVTSNPEEIDLE